MDFTVSLNLLKQDLGIAHAKRDEYLTRMLNSCYEELKARGVELFQSNIEDEMLLADFAAWRYRNRDKDVPLANNLMIRIRNKQTKGRCYSE